MTNQSLSVIQTHGRRRTEMFRAGMFPSEPDPTAYHPRQILMMLFKK